MKGHDGMTILQLKKVLKHAKYRYPGMASMKKADLIVSMKKRGMWETGRAKRTGGAPTHRTGKNKKTKKYLPVQGIKGKPQAKPGHRNMAKLGPKSVREQNKILERWVQRRQRRYEGLTSLNYADPCKLLREWFELKEEHKDFPTMEKIGADANTKFKHMDNEIVIKWLKQNGE